jgi:hypothetical protein
MAAPFHRYLTVPQANPQIHSMSMLMEKQAVAFASSNLP